MKDFRFHRDNAYFYIYAMAVLFMEVIYYGGPTAVIFPQKCARQHFQIADGRENTGKSRQMESKIRSTGRGIHFRRNMQKN